MSLLAMFLKFLLTRELDGVEVRKLPRISSQ